MNVDGATIIVLCACVTASLAVGGWVLNGMSNNRASKTRNENIEKKFDEMQTAARERCTKLDEIKDGLTGINLLLATHQADFRNLKSTVDSIRPHMTDLASRVGLLEKHASIERLKRTDKP